jgi:hypothetical protein
VVTVKLRPQKRELSVVKISELSANLYTLVVLKAVICQKLETGENMEFKDTAWADHA